MYQQATKKTHKTDHRYVQVFIRRLLHVLGFQMFGSDHSDVAFSSVFCVLFGYQIFKLWSAMPKNWTATWICSNLAKCHLPLWARYSLPIELASLRWVKVHFLTVIYGTHGLYDLQPESPARSRIRNARAVRELMNDDLEKAIPSFLQGLLVTFEAPIAHDHMQHALTPHSYQGRDTFRIPRVGNKLRNQILTFSCENWCLHLRCAIPTTTLNVDNGKDPAVSAGGNLPSALHPTATFEGGKTSACWVQTDLHNSYPGSSHSSHCHRMHDTGLCNAWGAC